MKKLVLYLLILISFYLIFNYFISKSSYIIEYSISSYNVKEYREKEGLYFEIIANGLIYNFMINKNLSRKAIKNIDYYSDDSYNCLMPIFDDNKTYTDVICQKENIQYFYNGIVSPSLDLTTFRNNFINEETSIDTSTLDFNIIYNDSLLEDEYIILNSYRGINIISKDSNKNIDLFDNDIYSPAINGLVGKYYIIANYNQRYHFTSFYIIDVETGKKDEISTSYNINTDAIIQGIYNNELYIYDSENKTQYKINPYKKTIKKINTNKLTILSENKLETYNSSELNNYQFDYSFTLNSKEVIQKISNNGYYYLIGSNIYMGYNINVDKLTYLFNNNYDTIKYNNNYACMLKGEYLYCYDKIFGLRLVLENKELNFNKNLSFEVYSK
ncbi:MAG: hypothetical protein PHD02_03405 [Bacilli bacterium]|nr:hypothetical protein [Bacilli bacterium]